jgi:hypothetical protein
LWALVDAAKVFDWVEAGRNLATIVAIVVGALWAFYVFVLERGFAAHVQRQFELKKVIDLPDGKILVISACVRNSGRTRVRKESCQFLFMPITNDQLNLVGLSLVEASEHPRHALSYESAQVTPNFLDALAFDIFEELEGLEPGEDAEEDILVILGNAPVLNQIVALKAEILFRGARGLFFRDIKAWATRGVLEIRAGLGSQSEDRAESRSG